MQKSVVISFLVLLLFSGLKLDSQVDTLQKWRLHAGAGQHSAKIGLPDMTILHPGLLVGASLQFNNSDTHQLRQVAYLGSFYHSHFQTAVQLYTEFHYEWHFGQNFYITPLAVGGGYVASFSDMASHIWDGSEYNRQRLSMKNNFVVSLGPSFGYKSPWNLSGKSVFLILGYRLQVQGVIVRSTVPLIVYSNFQLGVGLPL